MPETEVAVEAVNTALSLGVLLAAGLAALAVHVMAVRAIFRLGRSDRFAEEATRLCRWPARTLSVLVGMLVALPFTPLPVELAPTLTHLLRIAAVIAGTITFLRLAVAIETAVLSHQDMDQEDNSRARRRTTRAILLRRVASALILLTGIGAFLLTFETARTLGTSLLASAGVLGLVAGIAAQSTLGNIVSGIQVAVAEPIRIDDVVVVEGEWGNVEELTLTYVVVRTWDRRRLVLPTSYFVSTPFENWTMRSSQIVGPISWHLDPRVPLDAMREEFHRQVDEHPLWDGDIAVLQLIDTAANSVHVRGLVTAATSTAAWDLRCAIREGVLTWLVRQHPEAIPSTRLLQASPDRPTPGEGPQSRRTNRSPGPQTVPNPDPGRTGEWPTMPPAGPPRSAAG